MHWLDSSELDDTAFLWNGFRASDTLLSRDRFADLWVTDGVRSATRVHCEETLSSEPFVHCLRHRYFLELLEEFLVREPDGVLINLGAGFTNYAHLLDRDMPVCEVDLPNMSRHKRQRIEDYQKSGKLPQRSISFLSANLSCVESIKVLLKQLSVWLNGRPSFVLMEGLIFYLPLTAVVALFAGLGKLQKNGDLIAAMSFRPEESRKVAYQELVRYFRKAFSDPDFEPTALPVNFYQTLNFYKLVEHKNYYELAMQFAAERRLTDPAQVLEEDCYLLQHH